MASCVQGYISFLCPPRVAQGTLDVELVARREAAKRASVAGERSDAYAVYRGTFHVQASRNVAVWRGLGEKP